MLETVVFPNCDLVLLLASQVGPQVGERSHEPLLLGPRLSCAHQDLLGYAVPRANLEVPVVLGQLRTFVNLFEHAAELTVAALTQIRLRASRGLH
ncbi:hypothetical protein D3C86_1765110 [compost metagenome]